MSAIDELQLQRCVDGELSSEEQRELFARLDCSADGWRRLALLSLEERMLSHALRPGAMTEFVRPVSVTGTASVRPDASRSKQRWVVRGIAGAAAVVVVWMGLLLVWEKPGTGTPPTESPSVAETDPSERGSLPPDRNDMQDRTSRTESVPDRATPVADLRFVGVTDAKGTPLVIPVYEETDWSREWEAWQREVHIADSDPTWTEQGLAVQREQTWYAIPLANQQEILVPTETVVVGATIH